MAAKMAAQHLPQRYVGRGFFPAVGPLYPWRPRWPPYINFNVMPSGFFIDGGQDGRPTFTSTLCRAGIPPRRLGFFTHSGQDGRLTSTSMLCHQASLSMAAKMAAQHLPQCYVGRGFSPPSAFFTDGGQDGRPTFTSTLCRAGIPPRRLASLHMATRMVALHQLQRYVGRGFLPAIRLLYPWRPRWPPYIYFNVM
jgi:hypothetical protein